jgi:hypothetical protein
MSRPELDADTRAAAARLLEAGAKPEQVVDFIFQTGRMAGLMEAFTVMTDRIGEPRQEAA